MLLNILFVLSFCYFIEITKTHFLHTSNTKYAVVENKEELINFIRSLKYHQNDQNNEPDTDLNDEEKEKKLQNILWLLKRNYNAQKHFEHLNNNRFNSAARLYYIKNPAVLEEYKNHVYKIRRFSDVNLKNHKEQQNNLKNKLRNMRRGAIFRLDRAHSEVDKEVGTNVSGSSESDTEEVDKKEEVILKVRKDLQESNNPIVKIQKKEKIQDFKKESIQEYPVLKDSLEMHNTNIHHNLRSDYDFRREKNKWDERLDNLDSVETGRNKKNNYRNQPSHAKKRFDVETPNWDKITTRDFQIKYKKNKPLKEFQYKIKPSYNRPKNEYIKKDFHSYGRTSIPFVGKKGIYDEK